MSKYLMNETYFGYGSHSDDRNHARFYEMLFFLLPLLLLLLFILLFLFIPLFLLLLICLLYLLSETTERGSGDGTDIESRL